MGTVQLDRPCWSGVAVKMHHFVIDNSRLPVPPYKLKFPFMGEFLTRLDYINLIFYQWCAIFVLFCAIIKESFFVSSVHSVVHSFAIYLYDSLQLSP